MHNKIKTSFHNVISARNANELSQNVIPTHDVTTRVQTLARPVVEKMGVAVPCIPCIRSAGTQESAS